MFRVFGVPSQHAYEPECQYGTILSYNIDGGFGFIQPYDGGYTIFFHATDVAEGWRPPSKGHPLGFDLSTAVAYEEGESKNPSMQTQAYSVTPVRPDGRGGFIELRPPPSQIPFRQPPNPNHFTPPVHRASPLDAVASYRLPPPHAPAVSRKLTLNTSPNKLPSKVGTSQSRVGHTPEGHEGKDMYKWKDNHEARGRVALGGFHAQLHEADDDDDDDGDGDGKEDDEWSDEMESDGDNEVEVPAEACTEWMDTGARLMKMMGWKEGAGLGKDESGSTVPIAQVLLPKWTQGKPGLIAEGERPPAPVHHHDVKCAYKARPHSGAPPAPANYHGRPGQGAACMPNSQNAAGMQIFWEIKDEALKQASCVSVQHARKVQNMWLMYPQQALSSYLMEEVKETVMKQRREELTKAEMRSIRRNARTQAAQIMRMTPQCTMDGNMHLTVPKKKAGKAKVVAQRNLSKRPNPMRQGRLVITVGTIGQKKNSTKGPKISKNVATGGTMGPKIGKKQKNQKKNKK